MVNIKVLCYVDFDLQWQIISSLTTLCMKHLNTGAERHLLFLFCQRDYIGNVKQPIYFTSHLKFFYLVPSQFFTQWKNTNTILKLTYSLWVHVDSSGCVQLWFDFRPDNKLCKQLIQPAVNTTWESTQHTLSHSNNVVPAEFNWTQHAYFLCTFPFQDSTTFRLTGHYSDTVPNFHDVIFSTTRSPPVKQKGEKNVIQKLSSSSSSSSSLSYKVLLWYMHTMVEIKGIVFSVMSWLLFHATFMLPLYYIVVTVSLLSGTAEEQVLKQQHMIPDFPGNVMKKVWIKSSRVGTKISKNKLLLALQFCTKWQFWVVAHTSVLAISHFPQVAL